MTSSWKCKFRKKNRPFGVSLTVISLSNCQFFYYTLLKLTKKYEEERRKEKSSLNSANCTKLGLESSSFSPCKNIGLPPKRRLCRLSSQQSVNTSREVCLSWEETGICLLIFWSYENYCSGLWLSWHGLYILAAQVHHNQYGFIRGINSVCLFTSTPSDPPNFKKLHVHSLCLLLKKL